MQELVNHDDLGGRAILLILISELPSADANEPRAGLGKGQRRARAAARRRAVIEESQNTEGLGCTLLARRKRGREALAALIGKVGEEVLAAGVGETGGSALDCAPHSQSNVALHESEEHRRLRGPRVDQCDSEWRFNVLANGLVLIDPPDACADSTEHTDRTAFCEPPII